MIDEATNAQQKDQQGELEQAWERIESLYPEFFGLHEQTGLSRIGTFLRLLNRSPEVVERLLQRFLYIIGRLDSAFPEADAASILSEKLFVDPTLPPNVGAYWSSDTDHIGLSLGILFCDDINVVAQALAHETAHSITGQSEETYIDTLAVKWIEKAGFRYEHMLGYVDQVKQVEQETAQIGLQEWFSLVNTMSPLELVAYFARTLFVDKYLQRNELFVAELAEGRIGQAVVDNWRMLTFLFPDLLNDIVGDEEAYRERVRGDISRLRSDIQYALIEAVGATLKTQPQILSNILESVLSPEELRAASYLPTEEDGVMTLQDLLIQRGYGYLAPICPEILKCKLDELAVEA